MSQEDKDLLLKDLCARLPYGVKLQWARDIITLNENWLQLLYKHPEDAKPYLRPMSSMTEEEHNEYSNLYQSVYYKDSPTELDLSNIIDFLNTHHFDFRGLIPMGLALEAPEGMYKTE